MPIPHPLNISRHDENNRAWLTLSGEIDMETAPMVRHSLQRCLRDGIRVIDVDLGAVPFCDCSGLNAFLATKELTEASGVALRLHSLSRTVLRLLTLSGSGPRLLGLPAADRSADYPLPRPRARRKSADSPDRCSLADAGRVR